MLWFLGHNLKNLRSSRLVFPSTITMKSIQKNQRLRAEPTIFGTKSHAGSFWLPEHSPNLKQTIRGIKNLVTLDLEA